MSSIQRLGVYPLHLILALIACMLDLVVRHCVQRVSRGTGIAITALAAPAEASLPHSMPAQVARNEHAYMIAHLFIYK
ncbi:hypothetical protein [Cupriavidus oxalaticus]|uniref:hypothetical protein n=1 Tax=Cupriavidus oxalaticus TaxID=96344 RepID=UPI00316E7604